MKKFFVGLRVFSLVAAVVAMGGKLVYAASLESSCQFASYHCAFFWVINNFRFESWTAYW